MKPIFVAIAGGALSLQVLPAAALSTALGRDGGSDALVLALQVVLIVVLLGVLVAVTLRVLSASRMLKQKIGRAHV